MLAPAREILIPQTGGSQQAARRMCVRATADGQPVTGGPEVRVRRWRLQPHEANHIDDAHLDMRQVGAEQLRGERLQRRDIPGAGQHHIRLAVGVACPWPDAQAARAMQDSLVDRQVGQGRLLAGGRYTRMMCTSPRPPTMPWPGATLSGVFWGAVTAMA